MDQNIVLKIGELEFTLEQAIKEGIAQVLNAKVYISTDKALQLILPAGMKLSKEGVLLLDNGEDVQVTILDENGESILLVLKGMGTILATYDATNGDPLPFQVFQLGQQKLAFATLDDLTPAAAAGPQEGNQNQNSQQEDSNSNLQDYNQNNPNTNNPVVNGPVNDLTPRTTPTPFVENIIETDTPVPNNAPVIDSITAVNANEDDSIISGTVTSTDVDNGATATYSAPTTAGFTLNSSTGAYTFDPSDTAYQSLAQGEALTVTIPVTVTDDQGATDVTNIVINLTGTNDAVTAETKTDTTVESALASATSSDLDGFLVANNGNISYETTVSISSININSIVSQVNGALVALLPGATSNNVTVTSTLVAPNTYKVSVAIGDLPDAAASTLLDNSLVSTIFGSLLPVENAVHTGSVNIVDPDANDNITLTINPLTTNITVSTANPLLLSILDIFKDLVNDPSSITTTIKDLISNGLTPSTSTLETVTLNPTITKLLVTSGLLYINLEDNGDYTVYSPLFNMLNISESVSVNLGYVASDSLSMDSGVVTVVVNGTNDTPTAVDGVSSDEIASNENYEGALPGAYTQAMATNILNTVLGNGPTSLSTIIDQTALIDAVKTDLLANIDISVDPATLAQLQADLLPDMLTALNLTSSQIIGALSDITDPIYAVVNPVLNTYQNLDTTIQTAIETNLGDLTGASETALVTAIDTFISSVTSGLFSQTSIDNALTTLKTSVENIYKAELSALPTAIQTAIAGVDTTVDTVQITTDAFITTFASVSSASLAGMSFTLTDTPALQTAIATYIASSKTQQDEQNLLTALSTNNPNIGLLGANDSATLQTALTDSGTLAQTNIQTAADTILSNISDAIEIAIFNELGSSPISFDLSTATDNFVSAYANHDGDTTAQAADLATFQDAIFTGYFADSVTAMETSLTTDLGTLATNIISFPTDLADAIESGLGIVEPTHTFGETQAEFDAIEAQINAYDTARAQLESDILSLVGQFNNPTFNFTSAAETLILSTITNYGLDMNDVIINALPTDLATEINNFKAALSLDTSAILAQLDLNAILNDLGINLSIDTNAILSDAISQVKAYVTTLSLSDLASGKDGIATILDGLLDTVISIIDTAFDNIIDPNLDIKAAIVSAVSEIVIAEITPNITALGNELDSTFGLSGIDYSTLFGTIVNDVVTELTSGITLEVSQIKDSTLNNVFEQLGLDTGLLDPTTRTEISGKIVDDIFTRISMDEDLVNIATVSYNLDTGVSTTTTVFDENGDPLALDISADTTVTVNSDGTYTIENPNFATLNTLYSVEVTFDYYLNDNTPTAPLSESGISESKTMTVTIDFADTVSPGTLTDGYIANATVFADANENGVWDAGEAKTTTDAKGDFTLVGGVGTIVAIGGTDISTGLEFEGVFTAPEGSTVISPLTTLVDQVMKANEGMDTATASNLVATSLGLTGVTGEELLAFDPIKAATATDATAEEQATAVKIQTAAVQIVNVIAQTANAVESTGDDSTEEAALKAVSSLASLVQSGSTLDLSSSSTVESVLNDTLGDSLTAAQKTAIANATSNVNQAMQEVSDTNNGTQTTTELITKLAQTQLVANDVATEVKTSIKENTEVVVKTKEEVQTAATTKEVGNISADDALDNPIVREKTLLDINGEDTTYNGVLNPIVVEGADDAYTIVANSISIVANGTDVTPLLTNQIAITVNSDGTYSVVSPYFNGMTSSDKVIISFDYQNGESISNTVSLNVLGSNESPVLEVVSTYSIDEDGVANINFTASDLEGTPTTSAKLDDSSKGTVVVNDNGTITYTPSENFNGTTTITLSTKDSDGVKVSKTINVTVNDVNDAPTLEVVSTATVDEDGSKTITFTASDIDGTTSTTAIATNGEVVVNGNEVTFTPTANFNGDALITLTTTDDDGATVVKTINVTVNDVNDAPTLEVVSTATVDEDGSKTITFTASDIDGTTSTTAIATNGEVVVNGNEVTFTPTANFNGDALITLTTTDDDGATVVKTINVTVNDVNDAPTLEVVSTATVDEDGSKTITFTASDIDGTISTIANASNGTVSIDGNVITYTPNTNFNGSDVITLTTTDDDGENVIKTINVTVNDVNDAPSLEVASTMVTDEDTVQTITFTASDIDGTTSTTAIATNGEVVVNGNEVTFTPTANFNGDALITLTTTDDDGATVVKTINVTVNDVNDAPTLEVVSTATVDEDGSKTITFTASDIDGTTSTTAIATNGEVVVNGNEVTFTPTANFNGDALITLTTTDDDGATVVKTINVTVNDVNDAPTVEINTTNEVQEDSYNTFTLSQFDIDGTVTTVVTSVTNGEATVSPDGTGVVFVPTPNYFGPAVITLTTTDNDGAEIITTVNVNVVNVNDAPTLEVVSTATVDEDGSKTITFTASDIDGTTSTTAIATNGEVVVNGNEVTFTPTANFNGDALITLTTTDDDGATVVKTINVTVNDVNDAPTLEVVETLIANKNATKTLTFIASDIDGTVSNEATALNGTVTINGNEISYTPNQDYFGSDTITITTTDDDGANVSKTIDVTVNNSNNNPIVLEKDLDDSQISPNFTYTGLVENVDTLGEGQTFAYAGNLQILVSGADLTSQLSALGRFTVAPTGEYTISSAYFDKLSEGQQLSISFDYSATDAQQLTTSKTVTLNVTGSNDAPVITISDASTNEDTQVTIDFSSIDVDIMDSATPSVTSTDGIVEIINDQIAYTPSENFNGTSQITLSVFDGTTTTSKTINVTVNDVNDAPTLEVVSTATVDEDGSKTITFTASDIDGTTSTTAIATNGEVVVNGNEVTFTPTANFNGDALITLTTTDDDGATVVKTINVTVNDVNDAPTLEVVSTATVDEDGSKTITFTASDIDGTTSTTAIATNGEVVVNGNEVTFTPTANFNGDALITLTTTDDDGATVVKTINVTVNDVNDAPTLEVVSTATVDEDGSKTITFTASDIDGTTSTTAIATNGEVVVNGNEVTFTPTANFNGDALITLTTTDDDGATVVKTINVTVNDVNDAPTLEVVSTATVDEDGSKTITFTASDIDGTTSTTAIATNGEVVVNGNEVTFTPTANFNGDALITLTTTDDDGATVVKTINVTVNDVNDAPTISEDSLSSVIAYEDTTYNGQVLANDLEDTNLTYSLVSPVAIPGFVFNADGSYSIDTTNEAYQILAEGQELNVQFAWIATDSKNATTTPEVVNVTITGTNDAPVVLADTVENSSFDYSGNLSGALPGAEISNILNVEYDINSNHVSSVIFANADTLDVNASFDIPTAEITALKTSLTAGLAETLGFISVNPDNSISIGSSMMPYLSDYTDPVFVILNPIISNLETLTGEELATYKSNLIANAGTLQNDITDAILDAFSIVTSHTFGETLEEYNAVEAAILAKDSLKAYILSFASELTNGSDISALDMNQIGADLINITIHLFDLDAEALIAQYTPSDLSTAVDAFETSLLSIDVNSILATIDLQTVFQNVSASQIALSNTTTINEIIVSKQEEIQSYILSLESNNINLTDLQTYFTTLLYEIEVELTAAISGAYNEAQAFVQSLNSELETMIDDALGLVVDGIVSDFVQGLTVFNPNLDTVSLEAYIQSALETIDPNITSSITINRTIGDLVSEFLSNTPMGDLSTDALVQEYVTNLSNDIVLRTTMDADFADIPNLVYLLDDNVSVTTTVINLFGSTQTIEGTIVTINPDGTYSISNPLFASLDSSESVQVTFDYKVSDGITTSNSKTVTINSQSPNVTTSYVNPIAIDSILSDVTVAGERTLELNADIEHLDYVGNTTLFIVLPETSTIEVPTLVFAGTTLTGTYEAQEQGYYFDISTPATIEALLDNTITVTGLANSVDLVAEVEINIDGENYFAKSIASDNINTGTTGDDVITANSTDFVINALEGNDTIFYSANLEELDGGAGVDTLIFDDDSTTGKRTSTDPYNLTGEDQIIDLATILYNTEVDNIEIIDSQAGSDHILTNLTLEDFISMTDENQILKVNLDEGDSMELDSTVWEIATSENIRVSEEGFTTYTAKEDPNVQLLIEDNGNVII